MPLRSRWCSGLLKLCSPFFLACLLNIFNSFNPLLSLLLFNFLTQSKFYIKRASFCNIPLTPTMPKSFPSTIDLYIAWFHTEQWAFGYENLFSIISSVVVVVVVVDVFTECHPTQRKLSACQIHRLPEPVGVLIGANQTLTN